MDGDKDVDATVTVDADADSDADSDTMVVTMDAPQGLPQCHPFELSKLFVRDCYPEYYDYLKESMTSGGKRHIVVTGTPGIGKSVFYLYFFEQFKTEFPNQRIIVAAWTKEHKLKACSVWDPEKNVLEKKTEVELREIMMKGESDDLFLFDGIPDAQPDDGITIYFTSPDIDWFIHMNKFTSVYREIYMPNWTSKEIRMARDALQLLQFVSDASLSHRWNYFGGSVRYTLEKDQETVTRQILNVDTSLAKLKRIDDVLDCFAGNADPATVVHRLMHYDVQEMRGVFDRRLKPASRYIACKMQESLDRKFHSERQKLMVWLDGQGKPAAFLGWLFEGFAHEELLDGVDLPMRGLNAQATETRFKLRKTDGNYTKFKMAELETIFEDAYRTPGSNTLRSVDSYYLSNSGTLWLFQMTRDIDHKINLEGILELLEKLNKLHDIDNVNLVFVVPLELYERFPVQSFKVKDVFQPELTDDQVEALDCDAIPGIKSKKKRKLCEIWTRTPTVGDLLTAKKESPSKIKSVRSYVDDFEKTRARNVHQQSILNLKQYVMGLDYKPPTDV